jgi:hypothetical protein
MRAFQPFAWLLTVFAALLLSACGNDSSSSNEPTTVLIGKVTTTTVAVSAKNHGPLSACVVEAPEICSPVAADGTFTLRGLPEGSFSIQFFHGTPPVALGTPLVFEEVAPNQQITIEVELAGEEVLLVDEDRRGIGHAGVELEGPIQALNTIDPVGISRITVQNRLVLIQPGVTAIREGNTRKTVMDLTVGRRVHVKATTLEDTTDLLAFEIKLQGPEDDEGDDGDGDKKITICHLPGGDFNKRKTISISESAWKAHQKHGDTEGACAP